MNRTLVILHASLLPAALLLTQSLFGCTADEAASAWPVAGSGSGDLPATHHWFSGPCTMEQRAALEAMAALHPVEMHVYAYDFDTNPAFSHAKRAELGIQPIGGTIA